MRIYDTFWKKIILFLVLSFSLLFIVGYIIAIKVIPHIQFQYHLHQSLIMGGDWFMRNQTPAGDFNYELNVQTGTLTSGYNIVRQAGSLYSLSQLYSLSRKPTYKVGLEQGIHFFQQYFEQVNGNPTILRINYRGECKSNSVALFLLALIEYMEAEPAAAAQYNETAISLANYLLFTQTPHGSFLQTVVPPSESDYNNGESFYALMRMHTFSHDPIYLEGAKKAAFFIMESYSQKKFSSSLFAWAMEGFAYLYQVENNPTYWKFMHDYSDMYLTVNGGKYVKRYFHGESITPPSGNLGVFLEGLIHVAWIAKENDTSYYQELIQFIEPSLRYLMTLQINGPSSSRKTNYDLLSGGLCYDYACHTQRIDITHHTLSAIYLYLTLIH